MGGSEGLTTTDKRPKASGQLQSEGESSSAQVLYLSIPFLGADNNLAPYYSSSALFLQIVGIERPGQLVRTVEQAKSSEPAKLMRILMGLYLQSRVPKIAGAFRVQQTQRFRGRTASPTMANVAYQPSRNAGNHPNEVGVLGVFCSFLGEKQCTEDLCRLWALVIERHLQSPSTVGKLQPVRVQQIGVWLGVLLPTVKLRDNLK